MFIKHNVPRKGYNIVVSHVTEDRVQNKVMCVMTRPLTTWGWGENPFTTADRSVSPFTQATSYARTEYLDHHRVWVMQKPTDQNKDGFTNKGQGQGKKSRTQVIKYHYLGQKWTCLHKSWLGLATYGRLYHQIPQTKWDWDRSRGSEKWSPLPEITELIRGQV